MSGEYHEQFFKDKLDEHAYPVDPQDTRSYEQICWDAGLMPELPGQQQLPIDLSTSGSPEEAKQRLETARQAVRALAKTNEQIWSEYYGKP